MDISELHSFIDAIISNGFSSGYNNESIVSFTSGKSIEDLVIYFDQSIHKFKNKKKYPNLALIYFIGVASTANCINDAEILAIALKKLRSLKLLKTALKILISGKSKSMNYNIEILIDNEKNKFDYLKRYGFSLSYYENIALITLLRAMYLIDPEYFFDLLLSEKCNYLCITFFGEREKISVNDETYLKFLSHDDEVKAECALYKLHLNLFFALLKHEKNIEDETLCNEVKEACSRMTKLLGALSIYRQVKMILNYVFSEDRYPTQFIDLLNVEFAELEIRDFIQETELTLKNLISLSHLVKQDESNQLMYLKSIIMSEFCRMLEVSHKVSYANEITQMVNFFDVDEKKIISTKINELITSLRLSEFDRQVRILIHNQDENHLVLLNKCLGVIDNSSNEDIS